MLQGIHFDPLRNGITEEALNGEIPRTLLLFIPSRSGAAPVSFMTEIIPDTSGLSSRSSLAMVEYIEAGGDYGDVDDLSRSGI